LNPRETLRREAARRGFPLAGIARAAALEVEGARLREWLERGYDAGMGWMRRRIAERTDPRALLPGARSVVMLAVNYYTPVERSGRPGDARISRYAWGEDYHAVLGARLEGLAVWMRQVFGGEVVRAWVDTGPLMEKAWAQRGGIGWIGKHGNIITRAFGSWVFLGGILTTAELEPDPPARGLCGSCTRCIDACPTGAIVGPSVVDSNRCISYLTIEHRGEIAPALADRLGGWIFGCDICQDVCPWNRKCARPCGEPAFGPRPPHVNPPAAAWAKMTAREFAERFRLTPIRRATHAGLLRNLRLTGAGSDAAPRGEALHHLRRRNST
ncbi:MAG: tRNA epoxyqueuosine(34) reductase QueG, partial [Bacteroidota bacterium]